MATKARRRASGVPDASNRNPPVATTSDIRNFVLGIEHFLALLPALAKAKLPEGLVLGVLDGDEACIDELSQQLLDQLLARKQRTAKGETHLVRREEAIADSLVNYLAWIMLEVTRNHQLELRPQLVALLRSQLCGSSPGLFEGYEINQRRDQALLMACRIKLAGEEPSLSKVAKLLGLPGSTVSRWFPKGDLGDRARELAISVVKASTPEGWLEALRK